MTVQLTSKLRAFIELMKQSSEQEQRAFEALLKRDNFADYFDHLKEFRLFSPERNPQPISVDGGKYVRVPFWPALAYLLACAKLAGTLRDTELATKVLNVVREATEARKANSYEPDNYHTQEKFAEILGNVPIEVLHPNDIELLPVLLHSRYDRDMVCVAIDKGLLKRLLASQSAEDWERACRVLWHCTAIDWVQDDGLDRPRQRPVSLVDDYWLHELIKRNAPTLGEKGKKHAADVFVDRLREVFGKGDRSKASWLFRPAIEDHKQNYDWGGVDNLLVEGLREALLAWAALDASGSRDYVRALLADEVEILRRVALYIVGQKWDALKQVFIDAISQALFESGHLHELYDLLLERFSLLQPDEKRAVVQAIRAIPEHGQGEEARLRLRLAQRNWLSAIAGKGNDEADAWFTELRNDASLGPASEHPDFLSYMESWSGHGPTPIRPEHLVEYAKEGSLIERLNAFQPDGTLRGPTKRGLVDALVEAIKGVPDAFVPLIPSFKAARRSYQYGLISGFKELWDARKKEGSLGWGNIWPSLMEFFREVVGNDQFWDEPVESVPPLTPTKAWIPPIIVEFLRSGTRDDSWAYAERLLIDAWALLLILLRREEPQETVSEDAMFQAINSTKGKVIEAVFSHALRVCRIADRDNDRKHDEAWAALAPIFDEEVAKCRGANFEFSTLASSFVVNLDYMSHSWLQNNINAIFPEQFQDNFRCAVIGLAHASATRSLYRSLADAGVLDRGLRLDAIPQRAREHLVERISLAYLLGDEELSSSRFTYLFDTKRIDDLRSVSDFFWRNKKQEISEAQRKKILAFWRRCIDWVASLSEKPSQLLSTLSRLSVHVTELGAEETALMESIAPFVQVGYNWNVFVEQLLRLVGTNPKSAAAILKTATAANVPSYDYEGRTEQLVRMLADQRDLKPEAVEIADRLRQMLPALYAELAD